MEFEQLTEERRSVRSYEAGRTVSRETVEEIVRCAQYAPSWKNSETGRIYAAITPEKVEQVRETCLPAFNQKNTRNAAAYLTVTFKRGESGWHQGAEANLPADEWGAYDLGLQSAYLILKARDLGLDTLIMGLRDEEKLREVFSIPAEEEVMSVIALGYRDGEPELRPRKPLPEVLSLV